MSTPSWERLFDALDYIYYNYDESTVENSGKIKALLLDLAPDSKKETKAFLNILAEHDLIKNITSSLDVSVNYIAQQIEDISGLSDAWANKIAIALLRLLGKKDKTTSPTPQPKIQTTVQRNSPQTKPSLTQTAPSPIKLKTGLNVVGRLAVDLAAITATYSSEEQFSNPIELKMPDNTAFKFDLIDKINLNGTKYLIVFRDDAPNSVVFFIFKNPTGTANPPVFIPTGKNVKRIYRTFMADHKNEFLFSDADDMGPHIQPRKADQPREFTENTAAGMFGPHLRDIISIPAKYASIGSHLFKYANDSYVHKEISKLIIPDSVRRIESFAFDDIRIKDQIVIPDSVTDIGLFAFRLEDSGYIVCTEDSYAYRYAVENGLRNSVDIVKEYRKKGVCQYCGGEFKNKLFHGAVCKNCDRDKDY